TEDVRQPDRAGDVPVHLLEGDDEERGEEQEALEAPHWRLQSRSASSCDLASRDTLARSSSESGARLRPPFRQRAWRPFSASRMPSTSSGSTTTPAPVSRISSAAAPSGGTRARIGRSAARYSKTLPERIPRPRPPAS